jgi:hypothetical protein
LHPAPGESPALPKDTALDALVEQLGHLEYVKRDQALRELQARGAVAIPALRRAQNHPDIQVRLTVRDLLPAIEMAELMAPRRVTLSVRNQTLAEIFAEVSRQTGMKVEVPGSSRLLYSFDFKSLTFWEAVDQISRSAGLVIQPGHGSDRLILLREDAFAPYVVHQGPFRFSATSLQQTRNLDLSRLNLSKGPGRNYDPLAFSFTIHVEPRLQILSVGEIRLEAAYDNESNSMLIPEQSDDTDLIPLRVVRRGSGGGYSSRSASYQAGLTLQRPSVKATSIKVLRGTLPIHLLTQQKPVVLTDKIKESKGKKIKVDSTHFEILDVKEQHNGQILVRLLIKEEGKESDTSVMNSMYQRLQLFDAKDNAFLLYGTQWTSSDANSVELALTFGPPNNGVSDGPARLQFMSWKTVTHLLRFEFKDLPLP